MRLKFSSAEDLQRHLKFSEDGQRLVDGCMNEALPRWICTDDGQEWAERITKEFGRPKILVSITGDGYIEVMCCQPIDVKIVQSAFNGDISSGTALEEQCMEYTRGELSLMWRAVWDTGKVVASFMFKKLYLNRLHESVAAREILRRVDNTKT